MPTLQFDSQSNSAASANASKCRMLENDASDLYELRFSWRGRERERERERHREREREERGREKREGERERREREGDSEQFFCEAAQMVATLGSRMVQNNWEESMC